MYTYICNSKENVNKIRFTKDEKIISLHNSFISLSKAGRHYSVYKEMQKGGGGGGDLKINRKSDAVPRVASQRNSPAARKTARGAEKVLREI